MSKYLLTLLLLAGTVQGGWNARPITQDSLPFTAAANDSIYFTDAADTLYSASSIARAADNTTHNVFGIYINVSDSVFVDGKGKVLVFDTASSSSSTYSTGIMVRGPSFSDPSDHIWIKNLSLIHDELDTLGTSGSEHRALMAFQYSQLHLENCTLRVGGHNVQCFWLERGGDSSSFDNCEFENVSTSYDDRQYYGNNAGLIGSNPVVTVNSTYSNYVINSTVRRAPHGAFSVQGNTNSAYIYGCSIFVANVNHDADTLGCWPGGCNVGQSCENGYYLHTYNSGPVYFGHNYCDSPPDRPQRGTRGVVLDGAEPQGVGNLVEYNYMWIVSGPTGENATGWARGGRARAIDNLDVDSVWFIGNEIYGKVDTLSSTTDIGERWAGIGIGYSASYGPHYVRVENNHVVCSLGSYVPPGYVTGFELGNAGEVFPASWVVQNNYFETPDIPGNFGDIYNIFSGSRFTLVGDTFSFYNSNGNVTFFVGDEAYDADSITIRDAVFLNGTSDGDIDWHPSLSTGNVTIEYTMTVTVNDTLSNPVEGATVKAVATNGDTTSLGSTDANGQTSGILPKGYYTNTPDSTIYNDYSVFAYSGSDTTSWTTGLAWNNKDTTVTLAASEQAQNQRYILQPDPSGGGTATRYIMEAAE